MPTNQTEKIFRLKIPNIGIVFFLTGNSERNVNL